MFFSIAFCIPHKLIYGYNTYKSMEDMDRSLPCKTCRGIAMGIGSGYCRKCLLDIILESQRNIYPVSIKDIEERWKNE